MFNTIFFEPLYNAMVWLVAHTPGHSIALAVIILTLVVKLILSPLSYKALQSQLAQKKLQPELKRIKEEYPDKQEQSKHIMELYKKHKTNPFSGCLVLIIQMPIIFALYYVFLRGLHFNQEALYGSLHLPEQINNFLLGVNMSDKSTLFAVAAAVSQAVQLWFSPSMKSEPKETALATGEKKEVDFAAQIGSGMQKQMKYMMPILILIIGMKIPAAVALYWVVSNLFTLGQELLMRRRINLAQD